MKKNPCAPRPLTRQEIEAAGRLHLAFRDEPARGTKSMTIDFPRAVVNMGQVDFIGYTTKQAGKKVSYRHDFAAGSRPLLLASTKQGQLILIGRFRVTGRGVVDLDEQRREIDDRYFKE